MSCLPQFSGKDMESSSSQSSYDDRGSSDYSQSRSESPIDELGGSRFYVTKESQEDEGDPNRKYSYVGMRDLTDLDKIQEEDIKAPDGSVMGVKNRVRAGLAHFENAEALEKKAREEGRIILYLTSFRGVRSTFEDCRYVKTVLHNFRVQVEERDVYVNKFFYKELEDRLEDYESDQLPLPQVFISGQHIGSREEIEDLNETGELRRLLEKFKRLDKHKNCGYCGGFEFIPCRKCGGSKNSVKNNFTSEFKSLRCTHCNENGLEPCPECSRPHQANGSTKSWDKEELRKWREREEFERKEEEERRMEEKRERIKKEALEDEFKKKLKKEREMAEKQRRKEERRSKQTKEESALDKIARDIEMELEKERQWRSERSNLEDDCS